MKKSKICQNQKTKMSSIHQKIVTIEKHRGSENWEIEKLKNRETENQETEKFQNTNDEQLGNRNTKKSKHGKIRK